VAEFNQRILDGTKGRLKIEWFFLGEHPYERTGLIRALSSGASDLITGSGCYSGEEPRVRAAGVTGFAMLFSGADWSYIKQLNNWMVDTGVLDFYDDWNAQVLGQYYYGPQMKYMKETDITGPDSLKGKKVRVANPAAENLVLLMGGEPVSVKWAEVSTALSTGLVDGLATSFSSAYGMGFVHAAPHVSWLCAGYQAQYLVVNQDSLAELPPEVRDDFLATLKGMREWWADGEIVANLLDLHESFFTAGTVVQTIPQDWREEIKSQAYEKLWKPEIEAAGPEGEAIFKKIATKIIADGYDIPGYKP